MVYIKDGLLLKSYIDISELEPTFPKVFIFKDNDEMVFDEFIGE